MSHLFCFDVAYWNQFWQQKFAGLMLAIYEKVSLRHAGA